MKQFLIIGNKNAVTYKEIFPLFKENKLWIGVTPMGYDMKFIVSDDMIESLVENKKEGSAYKIENGKVLGRAQAVWFTNLDHNKRHEELDLYKRYNADEYPKYDNYDAFNVNKTAEIPMDDYIDIEIDPSEFPMWEKTYGLDIEILES